MEAKVLRVTQQIATVSIDNKKLSSSANSHSSRQVYLFEDFVIKFDAKERQNEMELKFYEDILEEKDAKYFPKLLGKGIYKGNPFLIQERVFNTHRYLKKYETILEYLQIKYELDDMYIMPHGIHQNIAITKEGIKIYDVGFYWGKEHLLDA